MNIDKKKLWKIIHWVIIINFLIQIGNGFIMVFIIYGGPPQIFTGIPLDFNTMVTRRLYAIETWIAIVGLSIYIAITEIYPRFKDEIAQKE